MKVEIVFTHEPLSAPPLRMESREVGACVEFFGIVREREQGCSLSGLAYEAHEPMARKHLERIFAELAVSHPVEAVVFMHRLGWVPVGEASMFVRVLSAHRGEALAFCGAAIDRMKQDVPIWKRATLPADARSR
ncbi:MAG: molybdenum cofactor biosynthesis protein MoaE [Chthoniobacteraceae bacterium]